MSYPSGLVTVIPPSHSRWKSVMANVLGWILSFISGFGENLLYSGVLPPFLLISL